MEHYYDTLKSNALWELSVQIFTCDETDMPLNQGASKVASAKEAKEAKLPYQITSGNNTHITV